MLSRLRANPFLRVALLAAALAFCGFGLASNWSQAHAALVKLHWYAVAVSFLAAAAGASCMILAWRTILADLGSELRLPVAVRVMSVAQLGKYLPGVVWAFAAQVELGHDYQVPRRRSAAAILVCIGLSLGTGLLLGTATLPIASASAARRYWWIMALAPVIALCLLPPVLRRLLDRAFRLAKMPPLENSLSSRGLILAIAWTVLGWMFWAVHAWLLVSDLTGRGAGVLLLASGAYALAWSAGLLLVVFPGGIGPRELAFVAALAPVMPRGAALLIALVSRIVMTASDIVWAGLGMVIARAARMPTTAHGIQRRSAGKHRRTRDPQWAPRTAAPPPSIAEGTAASQVERHGPARNEGSMQATHPNRLAG